MSQFHFDPATYLELMRAEVPAYARLQEAVAAASEGVAVTRVLDLGTGTGETLAAVLARHGDATAVGVDKSEGMLDAARTRFADRAVELPRGCAARTRCRPAPSTSWSRRSPSTTWTAGRRRRSSPVWRRYCARAGASCSETS